MATQFHLALPCVNIQKTRAFYTEIMGAQIGRSSPKWIDVNLFGHQITFTECGPFKFDCNSYSFNGDILPSFHFGIILQTTEWEALLSSLKSKNANIISEVKFLENKTSQHQSSFAKDTLDLTVDIEYFLVNDYVFIS